MTLETGIMYRHGEAVGCNDEGESFGGEKVTYPEDTRPCDAHVMVYLEDGRGELPCGAPAFDDERGFECINGHSYVYMDVRHEEGWDYADSPQEAAAMWQAGITPVEVY